jgi:hypothetical protein
MGATRITGSNLGKIGLAAIATNDVAFHTFRVFARDTARHMLSLE